MAKTKAKQDRNEIIALVTEALLPMVTEKGAVLWDVEFRREGNNSFLSIEIDKEGGVDIGLCETISREIEAYLDRTDPIEEAYYLEVGSAGLERSLKKPAHFEALLGQKVVVKFFAPNKVYGKEFEAVLEGFHDGVVILDKSGEKVHLALQDLANVKLAYVAQSPTAGN